MGMIDELLYSVLTGGRQGWEDGEGCVDYRVDIFIVAYHDFDC